MTLPAPIDENPTLRVGEDLHPAAEHGSEHVVVFGQSPHRGVEKRPADVELDVLGALRFQPHVPFAGHDARAAADASAAASATVQIAATAADAAAATAAYASYIKHPLLDGEGLQRG